MVAVCIYLSLNYTNNDPKAKPKFYFISTLLGVFMLLSFVYASYAAIYTVISESLDASLIKLALNSTEKVHIRYLVYIFSGGLALPVLFNLRYAFQLLYSLLHYLWFSPSYIHLFFIYAFCRIDDLSWGTKGDVSSSGGGDVQ
jgi:chitin synthase